jgi:gliding motility-associated-like protein
LISQNKILRLLLFAFAICFLNEKSLAQMEFVQNKGQWNSKVNYKGDFSTGAFFLENKGFTVLMNKPEDVSKLSEYTHGHGLRSPKDPIPSSFILHSFAYNVSFLGASSSSERIPDKPLPSYNNYFIGNDQKKWAADCKIYTAITYKNVYPNIDVRYYSTADKLKYDFIVHPGGNPAAIAMRFDGGVTLNIKNKELIIGTPVGEVKEMAPYSYQTDVKGSNDVNTKYVIKDNVVSFNTGKYDPTATLIIDPQIVFSSFTGSLVDNWGYTATPGPDGSFFAGGIVFGTGYPVSPGAFQTIFAGGIPDGDFAGIDMAIFKFSANGSTRLYATYIGGSGNEQPHSMITDAAGNLIIAGRSSSSNYPIRSGIALASTNFDIVVTKLNSAGTLLIGSVKIGGSGDDGVNIRPKYSGTTGTDRLRRNYGDDARSEVILDKSNNIYVASCTQSINFPTLFAIQSTPQGAQDGVILKFNSDLSGLLYSTLFGGNGEDACFVAAINPTTNNLFVGGATSSNNLPGNTAGTISPSYNGNIDGFVTEIPSAGGAALRTTYLGTGSVDLVYGLKFDRLGFPYVMGTSTGTWPVINATYQVPGSKQFIAKLQPNLSAYVYSTKFGTSSSNDPNISPIAFLVDRCENVYVSGWGGGLNIQQRYSQGSTGGLPQVNPLIGIPNADGSDFYFFVLRKDAQSQLFGSHFGQNQGLGDHVDGGTSRFDDNGVIYQAMCANCGGRTSTPPISFPTTPGVWAGINGSRNCNEAAVKIEMNFAGIGAEIQSEIDGEVNDSLACVGSTVNFKDLKAKGITYYWNFNCVGNCTGVDATTTSPQIPFTFNAVGTYRVRLIAEDLSTCNLRDTSYITIRIGQDRVVPSFTTKKIGPCTSRTFEFTNTTVAGIPFLPQTFVWDFGDGSPVDTADFGEIITHPYAATGTYNVKLRAFDTRFCNAPKDTIIPLRINDNVKAIPETKALGCALYIPIFQNKSLAGLSWKWELLNATTNTIIQTSTDFVPTFTALNIGLYKYRLIALDSTTCNKIDTSAYFNIEVVQRPQASGDWAPNPPQANVPVRFSNFSTFANNYVWLFGDGETSTEFQPTHEYNATGTYTAKLVAISIAGCTDTFPLIVNVIINPLLDVPNAFTPGRFGINSVVSVRGFGIDRMDWRIFNRWGQIIFRSSNKKQGWDGYYKGKLQPIDVYSYILDIEFTDGKRMQKTGDITLLR